MALVSVAPLVSRWGLNISIISSTKDLTAFCKPLSTIGQRLSTKQSVTPITTSMMFTVEADDAQRRIGNHDDVVQCLSTPYGAPEYRQRAETLIEDIKLLLASELERSCSYSDDDLIKRLQIVNSIECLGIDRHFQPEMKLAIDYVYRYWNERGIGVGSTYSLINDLNTTALGFRALRLHRYNVSSAVFENFKDENGKFFSSSAIEEGEGAEGYKKYVRCMLSLLRASNISYPGETVMEEAKSFATNYLKQVLAGRKAIGPVDQSLLEEVKYALEFPWHCTPPRLDARNFIEIYGQNDSWLKSNMNKFLLELAKLDFNILQFTHQKEIQIISRWFTDSGIAHLNFYRKLHVEIYFWVVTGIFEPEFCGSRIAFTKLTTLMTILDDLYDTHGKLEQLKIFTEGVRRWDLSLIKSLPDSMKTTFEFFFKTSNELIAEVEKVQGRDMAAYIRKNGWEQFLGSYLQDAEWLASGHVPTFDEYMKNGTASTGMCILNLIPLLLMGQLLPQDILEQIYSPSRFHQLLEFVGRLVDDARDFQTERETDGGDLSCIECYLKDHPECTVEDALNHVNGLLDISLQEINMEFLLKHDSVPLPCKKYTFNTLAQGVQLMYKGGDGFPITTKEVKDQLRKVLFDPVPI